MKDKSNFVMNLSNKFSKDDFIERDKIFVDFCPSHNGPLDSARRVHMYTTPTMIIMIVKASENVE